MFAATTTAAILCSAVACAPRSPSGTAAGASTAATPAPAAAAPDLFAAAAAGLASPEERAGLAKHLSPGKQALPAPRVFRNVQILQGADAGTAMAAMHGMSRALGEKCTFCHEENDFPKDVAAKREARQMLLMTERLNRAFFDGRVEVTCWTCHRGHPEGEHAPPEFAARIRQAIPEGFVVPPADAEKPAGEVFRNLEVLANLPAGKLPTVMGAFNVALGVDCAFCHVKDDPASDDNEHKRIARDMMRMSAHASADLAGTSGEITCWTCHRGSKHPATAP